MNDLTHESQRIYSKHSNPRASQLLRVAQGLRLGRVWAVLGIMVVFGAFGCTRTNQYVAPPPPEVSIAQPVSREVVDELEFTGTTRAKEQVSIRARVSGYLKSIEFEDGADVREGQPLFLIEPEPFEAALASAKANLQKAQASESFAKAEVGRTEPLVRRGALTEQELESKKADFAVATAEVAAARAAMTQAELNVSYTKITSPISGRTGRHMVDVGNLVQIQETVLTTVESYEPIYAYFSVSENDMLRLRDAGEVPVSTTDSSTSPKIYLGLSNEEGFPHQGALDFSELGVDRSTGTQLRRAIFDNTNGELVPGLFVRIRLPVGGPQQRLLIDERAIGADQRGEFVLVVDQDNKVEQRPVRLGVRVDGLRVVYEGLKPNDWLVVNGVQRARPGATVNPKRVVPQATPDKTGVMPVTHSDTAMSLNDYAPSVANPTHSGE